MTMVRRAFIATLCSLAVAGAMTRSARAADGTVVPLPQDDQQQITAKLGSGVVGTPLPSQPIADPSVYFPLQERSATYLVTNGPNAGNLQTLGVMKRNRPTGAVAWRAALSPTLAGFVQQTATGDLVMPSVTDSSHDVVVLSTPSNPFVLKGMQPGQTRTFSQQVSVNYLDDPTRQDYGGSMQGSYTYLGTYQVMVPAGTYSAALMRVKVAGKVGPAHTEDTAYYFFAPQVGVVAMISQEDVEAFWIIHIDSSTGKVLTSN